MVRIMEREALGKLDAVADADPDEKAVLAFFTLEAEPRHQLQTADRVDEERKNVHPGPVLEVLDHAC